MRQRHNGLEDSDKIFITVALWIATLAIFVTALTLPMLPPKVNIFYQPVDLEIQSYSKYNNLLLMLVSVIPMAIVLLAASLKKHGKIRRNFPSVLLFCMILSACMGGVTIYGIMRQFDASQSIKNVNINQIIMLSICFLLSMVTATAPSLIHMDGFEARSGKRSMYVTYIYITFERFWYIGAYGFLFCSIAGVFVPGYFSYIPLAIAGVAYLITVLSIAKASMRHRLEVVLFDAIEN